MVQKVGRIVTFYSYKGGTGRTMALSNVAWILASNGKHVLLIDWDLEAPGLHRYLRPFLIDPELASTAGLIDFVWDAAQVSVSPVEVAGQPALTEFPSLEDYVVGLNWDFQGEGSISFIPAGRQDENYAQRVNTFDWDNFYARLGGGKILHLEAERLRESYDFILIDSRTGVSDTSSICTVQMPDILAVFFTLNRQSIKGSAAVTRSIQAQRGDTFPIFPVPTRIENAENDKLVAALAYARRMFAPFLMHVQPDTSNIDLDQQKRYWNDVETPYRTFYAFEEVPPAFKDEPGSLNTVLSANERLASWMTRGIATSLQPASEQRRQEVVNAYAFTAEEDREFGWGPDKAKKTGSFLRRFVRMFRGSTREQPWRWATIVACLAGVVATIALTFATIGLRSELVHTNQLLEEQSTRYRQLRSFASALGNDLDDVATTVQRVLNGTYPQARLNPIPKQLRDSQTKLNNGP
jgi:MinD-like ATPase involved in chromosome partitioning or flagellar assembly